MISSTGMMIVFATNVSRAGAVSGLVTEINQPTTKLQRNLNDQPTEIPKLRLVRCYMLVTAGNGCQHRLIRIVPLWLASFPPMPFPEIFPARDSAETFLNNSFRYY